MGPSYHRLRWVEPCPSRAQAAVQHALGETRGPGRAAGGQGAREHTVRENTRIWPRGLTTSVLRTVHCIEAVVPALDDQSPVSENKQSIENKNGTN